MSAPVVAALQSARVFVSDELECRRRSFLPDTCEYVDSARSVLTDIEAAIATVASHYQDRVMAWSVACFGVERANDLRVRNCRFLEEALELVQSGGLTREDCILLVDYVFARPVGDQAQEVGGTMVTVAALCAASGVDLNGEAERELARIWTKIEKIRAKQAEKDQRIPVSPLPMALTNSPFEPGSPADYSWIAENIGSVGATERQMNAAEARILERQAAESGGDQ